MILDQVAYYAHNDEQAAAIAAELGLPSLADWVEDTAIGHAVVRGIEVPRLVGKLRFSYARGMEIEILTYLEEGHHWHVGKEAFENGKPFLSHIGYHLNTDLGEQMPDEFAGQLVQELWTDEHSNKAIPRDRRYHYRIFESMTGVDQKIIARLGR
jgi:hypothetical protein